MATKLLDLNALEQPILEVKLRDDNRTIFRLTTPTTKLVEKFISARSELSDIVESKDADKIRKLYELAAEMISCNVDYLAVSAEDLRDKYRVTFGDLVVIFAAYLDFIKEFNSAKN